MKSERSSRMLPLDQPVKVTRPNKNFLRNVGPGFCRYFSFAHQLCVHSHFRWLAFFGFLKLGTFFGIFTMFSLGCSGPWNSTLSFWFCSSATSTTRIRSLKMIVYLGFLWAFSIFSPTVRGFMLKEWTIFSIFDGRCPFPCCVLSTAQHSRPLLRFWVVLFTVQSLAFLGLSSRWVSL